MLKPSVSFQLDVALGKSYASELLMTSRVSCTDLIPVTSFRFLFLRQIIMPLSITCVLIARCMYKSDLIYHAC